MTDAITRRKIVVSSGGDAWPYIIVPDSQIEDIQRLLQGSEIPHWIDEAAIALDGKPAIGVVNLARSCDPARVQAVLDAVP